jgi:hypothetical protein
LVAEDEADGDEEDEAARARPEPETGQPAACMPPELPAPLAPVLTKPRVPGPLNPAPAPAQQPNPVALEAAALAALEGDFARLPPRMAEAARRIVASTLTNADFR